MWELLWKLPYNIAVVPRHPFPEWFLDWINIPENVTIINKVWVLKSLCANTSLVVMGLIFSNKEWEMDHSPLEATINSNAISWFYDEIEDWYKDFYTNSWLIHRYNSFEESIDNISNLINDYKLKEKLEKKQIWIKKNKEKYLKEVLNILLKN
jgi:transaldolase